MLFTIALCSKHFSLLSSYMNHNSELLRSFQWISSFKLYLMNDSHLWILNFLHSSFPVWRVVNDATERKFSTIFGTGWVLWALCVSRFLFYVCERVYGVFALHYRKIIFAWTKYYILSINEIYDRWKTAADKWPFSRSKIIPEYK